MNKKTRSVVLAFLLTVVCLFSITFGLLSTETGGFGITASAAAGMKITTQPKSVTVASGKTAIVKVVASGEGLTYQWYYKNAGASKFSVSSVKTATYTVEMSKSRHGREIYCVVTDKNGNKVKSNVVTLSMSVSKATITKQPKSVSVASGKTATTTVYAAGSGLTYQWYYKNAGATKFSVSSVKTATYFVEMSKSRHGREIYCVVTDKNGNKVKSNTVTLSMTSEVKITAQPKSITVASGKTATVKVAATGSGLTYKWYYKNAGATKFSVSSVKTATYSVEMSKSRHGREIYCVVTDKNGNKVKSNVVTLSMSVSKATITKQPKSVSVASGKTAMTTVYATGSGLTYKWYYKNAGASKFSVSSVKTATYSVEMNNSRHGREIYCVVTDKNGNKVKSNTVTLSIVSEVKITAQPQTAVAPKGETATLNVAATGVGLTYKWYYKNAGATKFSVSSVKTATYSVEMSASRDGREIYCVVTDKYGVSVQTKTVTLHMGTPLSIKEQPTNVTAKNGGQVLISFTAEGDGLSYKWYYKDADASNFSVTKTFTSNSYTVEMSADRSGRQVYCVVTDKYGFSVKTNVATMCLGTPIRFTMQPESVTVDEGKTAVVLLGAVGEGNLTYQWYYKDAGATKFSVSSVKTATYSVEMNNSRHGREIYCVVTDKNGAVAKSETVTLSMTPAYQITVDLGYGEPYVVNVNKDGKYDLGKPSREGFSFKGWKTLAGKDFAKSGTISMDVTVKAVWDIAGTDTLNELISRVNAGATEIVITGNITINQPIYVSHDITIYSNKNYTLKRDSNYGGDLFVVGKDANGVTALHHHRAATLTLGGGKGTLTIDGNKDNMKVDVVGSLIFAGDSCTVNLYDGVSLCNNKKTGNERVLTYIGSASESTLKKAGGAAILNNNSVVNMYGGIIENNIVKTEHTVVTDETGAEVKYEYDGCGGAVYSDGSFNMYGGTIQNNEALRGGAVYMVKPTVMKAGTIQGNKSYTYGGAVSTNAGSYANLYLGGEDAGETLAIKDNYSKSAGGALYSNTTAPIVVLGNVLFEGNHSDYSGGAIYTGGSLVVRDSTFRGNSSVYSAGAIYFHNTKDSTWQPREAEITGCLFEENKASLGGAIAFSRSNGADPKATGVVARVTDCRFYKNEAIKNDKNPGNGGAMYITQLAKATITGCVFEENVSANSGGAVGVHGEATATLTDLTFQKNTAPSGGALYLSINTTNTLKNLTFTENKAVLKETGSGGNGGAIYATQAKVTAENLDIRNNTAATHAGAIYLQATTLTLGADTTIESNSAGDHGGAFYLTYTTNEDNTKTGSHLILNNMMLKDHTAKVGGVISIRTDCEATLTGVTLKDNAATIPYTADGSNYGGGAVYVGYGTLTLKDTILEGNTSAYYGGAVYSRSSHITIDGGSVTGSTGATGAALYFAEKSTVELKNLAVKDNTSSTNGVIYANGGTLTMDKVTANGNKASSGGVLFTSGAHTVVTLKDSVWSNNSASSGGAINMTNASVTVTNCEFNENTARLGGAIYNKLGTLVTDNVTFFKNAATKNTSGGSGNGGAVCMNGGTFTVSEKDSFLENTAENHAGAIYVSYFENETTKEKTGGVLTATGGTFTGNTAMGGGAVSIRTACEANFDGTTFTGNSVTGNDGKADGYGEGGGAVYVGYGKLTLKNVTTTGNQSENFGGAVHVVDSQLAVSGSAFAENEAKTGGAVYMTAASVASVTDSAFTGNSATGNGGALYLGGAEVTTDNLDMQNNSASGNGGALYLMGREMTVDSGDTFKNNSAGGHGGAIYLVYKTNTDKTRTGATLNATDVTFEGNTAMAGGAISARSACIVNLDGTTLKNNSVTGFVDDGDETTSDNNGDGEGGGAIYVGYGTLNMKDVTATGNTASDFGGVVDAVASPVTITGGTYSDNTSNNGGVLHAMTGSAITVNGTTFTGNKSLYANTEYDSNIGGGVFHTIGGTLHITGCTLDGNTSQNYGGVLHTNKTEVTVDGETQIKNSAGATGAVMHMRSAKATLENISITDNTSRMNGVIYYAGSDLTLKNVTATGNKAHQGGVMFVNSATVTVADSTFSGNSATNGGVIYTKGGATVNVENSAFTENTATYGGAIYLIEESKLNLTGATFTKNSATKDGGAIYNKASTVTGVDTETAKNTFTENTAASHGGAIYVVYATNETTQEKTGGALTLTGGTFTGNTAMGGGAISLRTACEASLDGTTFTENYVTGNDGKADGYSEGGGAIYAGYGKLTLTNVTATGNQSENYGGAVQLVDTETTITGGTFTGNKAATGGAIYTMTGNVLNITGSAFTDNTATGTAGAVAVMKPVTGALKDLTFTGNHADGNGGAVYFTASVTTENLDMQENSAGGNGGAVYLNAVAMTVTANDVFKGNTAGGHGGAIYLTYNGEQGATLTGTDAVFENNTAKAGGAISSRSYCSVELTGGSLKGNIATAAQPEGLGGGAIYSNTNTLKLHGVTLEGNTAEYYGGAIYTSEANVTIDEKSVIKGNGAVTGVALYFKASGTVTMNDVTVTENVYTKGTSNGLIYVGGAVTLDVANLTATNNKSVNGGVFYISGSVGGTITESTFTGNNATANGGAIDFRSSGTLNVTNSTLTGNSSKNGGAIYCEKGIVNVSGCQVSENTATETGGAISVAKTGKVNVVDATTLTKNSASTGGAVYLDRGGSAELIGVTLEENSATGKGGAIAATDTPEEGEEAASATLTLVDATLKNNTAKNGGAVYADADASVTVTGGAMTQNTATLGGAAYVYGSTMVLNNAVFTENSATSNGGAIDIVGGTVTGKADFERNTAAGHAGAIYVTYIKEDTGNIGGVLNLTGGSFTGNTAMGGGAVSVRTAGNATFENVTFTGNCVSGCQDDGKVDTEDNDGDGEGGGAIYVGYGSVTLTGCTATGNTSTDSFGGFMDSVKGVVNITGGTYTGNTAPAGGAIYSLNKSTITITDAVISENESTFVNPDSEGNYNSNMGGGAIAINGGTLTVSNTTLSGNKSVYYGGTIMADTATVTLDNNTVVSGSTGKTGSAIYIRDNAKVTMNGIKIQDNKDAGTGVIYAGSGTLELINVTATGNTASTGAVVAVNGGSTTLNITGGTYSGNSAKYGGVFYVSNNAKATVNGAIFTENTSYLGGAGYVYKGTLTLVDATFTKNTATKEASGSNGNGGAITVSAGTITGSGNNVFSENTAENHGGAIYVVYATDETTKEKTGGVLNMTDGTFENNTAYAGGAISSRTAGSVTLTGTVLKENASTASGTASCGGAIYTNDGTLTLSGVTLDGNTSNYYGAAVYSTGTVFTATDNCVVQNNTGITGAALWLSIGADQTATITDMTLYKNLRKSGTGNGTIYANGSGALNITGLTASENVSTNGGVLYTSGGLTITLADSTITDNQALTNGGVIAYRGTKTMVISGCTFTGNTAPTGGVIEASGSGTVTVKSSTLENNTATTSGGAIYATGSGKVVVSDNTLLKNNSAPNGGAVCLDLGATVTIDNSTLDGNSATTGVGGAILVQDSTEENPQAATKLVMTNTTLQNNTAKTRGGALATDTASPALIMEVTGCTFYNNSVPTSGGAVCVQNGNCNSATEPTEVTIVFTNCTFQENSSDDIGGALDVRSGSCTKIDGITAKNNTAKNNAGVVYVTSNNSRLYLTGEVVLDGNTAKNGAFSYLYNNNYSNPPKIYTTHSNTATWYADVAGNKTNVAFDLTTLP